MVGQIKVRTASGVQTLDQSYAHVTLQGKSMVESVLIIDTLETLLVGVRTLEGMGWAVDPSTGELKESDILLLSIHR
jgi:predicted aspartyl protease